MASLLPNLLRVCVDDKYGYINLRGELVRPCQYDYASEFSEGLATIQTHFDSDNFEDHEIMVINNNFEEIGRLRCENWGDYSEGLMSFERNDKCGYVNTALQVVILHHFGTSMSSQTVWRGHPSTKHCIAA